MLYCFDVDGTLIRSFLRNGVLEAVNECPRCGERGTVEQASERDQAKGRAPLHCEMCPWQGTEAEVAFAVVDVLQGRRHRIESLALQNGARFALVTNQGGVGFGFQTPGEVWGKLGRVAAEFQFFDGCPFSVHACFSHPKATLEVWRMDSGRRKPGPGMLIEAMKAHRADRVTTWMVGDLDTDRAAAEAAGINYYDAEVFFR